MSIGIGSANFMDDNQRKRRLRQFLMERRARLKPSDVGLPSRGQRRCPGLRREEVAELVGVSATWYTLLEMARGQRRPSVRMVERVGDVLMLDERDRVQLMQLAIPELGRASANLENEVLRRSYEFFEPMCRIARRLANVVGIEAAEAAALEELVALQPHFVHAEFVRVDRERAATARAGSMTVPLSAHRQLHDRGCDFDAAHLDLARCARFR